MATGKRYYWIKLKTSFLTSETVQFLMSQDGGNGANYVVLYQMLCLITINTDGKLERQIGEVIIPYDVEKIRQDCKYFSADTIRVAMELYMKLGLIYRNDNGCLVIANHHDLIGSETDWALQKRKQGSGNAPQELPPADMESGVENFHTEYRDKSIENRDKSKEIRNKRSDNRDANTMGSQPSADSPKSPPVAEIILNDKSLYPLYQEDADEYAELYPAVDILQEFRKMVGWCKDNPKYRKTRSGIRRFINSWLSRAQDKATKGTASKPLKPGMGTVEERQAAHGFTPTEFN